MVPEFEKWAMDDSRKYGDVAIVKSKYGYHIMYFIDKCPQYQYNCKRTFSPTGRPRWSTAVP